MAKLSRFIDRLQTRRRFSTQLHFRIYIDIETVVISLSLLLSLLSSSNSRYVVVDAVHYKDSSPWPFGNNIKVFHYRDESTNRIKQQRHQRTKVQMAKVRRCIVVIRCCSATMRQSNVVFIIRIIETSTNLKCLCLSKICIKLGQFDAVCANDARCDQADDDSQSNR